MTVSVNGKERTLAAGATVAELLDAMGVAPDARGIAVAVDAEVVPRGAWARRPVPDGARVEVLHAVQGG